MPIKLTSTLEGDLIIKITKVKPGLHISPKDRKHMVAKTRLLSFPGMPKGYFSLNDFYAWGACNGQNSKE